MIEHTAIPVKNLQKSKDFYSAALKPLGYKLKHDWSPAAAGYMEGGHTSFVIGKKAKPQATHLAFRARSRKAVQDFYKAAIAGGGKDNGKPGIRKGYGYAAFVYDLDSNNIEAVYFGK